MVRALDRGDAVDLDEAQPLDQPCKIFSLRRAPKAVPVEEQLPGSPVGEARQRLAGTATHENLAPIPRTRSQSPHSLQGQEFFGSLPGPNRPPANNDEPASEPAPPRVSLECAGVRCWQDRRQHRQLLEAVGFRARHHGGPPASRHGAGPLQTYTRERGGPRLFAGCESRPAIPFGPLHCPWEQAFMSDDDPVRTWLEDFGDSGHSAEANHLAMDRAPALLATSGSPAAMSQSLDTCAV